MDIEIELFIELVTAVIKSKTLINIIFSTEIELLLYIAGNLLRSEHTDFICEILKHNKSIKKIDLGNQLIVVIFY